MRDSELKVGYYWDHPMDAMIMNLQFMIPGEQIDSLQTPMTNSRAYEILKRHLINALAEIGFNVDHGHGVDRYSPTDQEHQTGFRLARDADSQRGNDNYPLRELE